MLLSSDEARHAVAYDDMYVIKPLHEWWSAGNWKDGRPVPEDFQYTSDTNSEWLQGDGLRALVEEAA